MPDEELPDPKPEILYHYTTIDAMMSIAKCRKIWATNISYLNDSSEGVHLLGMIRKRLPEPVSYTHLWKRRIWRCSTQAGRKYQI